MTLRCHAVLAAVSRCYPPPQDRYLRVTHPSATRGCPLVRLACVKHAASVRSEPGSNSQVHPCQSNHTIIRKAELPGKPWSNQPDEQTQLNLSHTSSLPKGKPKAENSKHLSTHSQNTSDRHPIVKIKSGPQIPTNHHPNRHHPDINQATAKDAANVSLPFSMLLSKNDRRRKPGRAPVVGRRGSTRRHSRCQRRFQPLFHAHDFMNSSIKYGSFRIAVSRP